MMPLVFLPLFLVISQMACQARQIQGICRHPVPGLSDMFKEGDVVSVGSSACHQDSAAAPPNLPPTNHTCRANGEWEPPYGDPCRKPKCSFPGNGTTPLFYVGQGLLMAQYCNHSLINPPPSSHTCQPDGQWKPPYVDPCRHRCACTQPPHFQNAEQYLKRKCPREGTKALYSCRTASPSNNGGILVCSNGQWHWQGPPINCSQPDKSRDNTATKRPVTCKISDLRLQIPPGVSITGTNQNRFQSKQKVALQCEQEGYVIEGPSKAKCNKGGIWRYIGSKQMPRCRPRIQP